jgi:hypothetical protein
MKLLCAGVLCVALAVPAGALADWGAVAAGKSEKKRKVCNKKKKKGIPCKDRPRPLPGPGAPGTKVRATLTWASTADIDLHAYDMATGQHAGVEPGSGGEVVNGITGATHSGNDSDGPGVETFTDNFYGGTAGVRRFGFMVCWAGGHTSVSLTTDDGSWGGLIGPAPGPEPAPFTIGFGTGIPAGADPC